jgi:hypothetical protein
MTRAAVPRLLLTVLLAFAAAGAAATLKPGGTQRPPRVGDEFLPAKTLVFYGAMPGKRTLDRGARPGNPFATATIEALAKKDLSVAALSATLEATTAAESRGFQAADVPPQAPALQMPIADGPGSRVALVVVVSDYARTDTLPSLPGAKHDAERIAAALSAAGFSTTTSVDEPRAAIEERLAEFAARSAAADTAAIYVTGHGLEVARQARLLMRDFQTSDGVDGLPQRSLRIADIAAAARARTLNLVFSAGCRDNPFGW